MAECKFVVAACHDFAVERTAPHFCAQTARVFLLADVEDNLGNVGSHNVVLDTELVAKLLYRLVGIGGKPHVYCDTD